MAIIKCKMCGGDIDIAADKTFGTCEYCGSAMTLPKVDDEQRAAAFNRGNHFRRTGEFDKALAVYEHIVMEDNTDAEAHWCCALCRFGIEYVEDPVSYEWIPTCHRASFDNFLEDVDYLAALEYSDGVTKRQYQKDAAKIAEVQKGILATSQNEEPFDVFICYKESVESGERTVDSTLAQDIYYQLTEEGYRVFFSRITLEDKVGTEYEPYIFAALNSAKVMICIGTKEEYYNSVWVKNEWSRFLALMKKDRSRLLIPCYRDMDPYDMPESLSVLQSYDMSKIGFIQDLIRGIKKVLGKELNNQVTQEKVIVQNIGNINEKAMFKRGQLALEDKEWERAKEFFENVLNVNAESAEAYQGLFLVEMRCSNMHEYVVKETEESKQLIYTMQEIDKKSVMDEYAKKYTIPNYLSSGEIKQKIKELELSYNTPYVEAKRKLKEKKKFFSENLQWNKIVRFANDEILNETKETSAHIIELYEKTLDEAKSLDDKLKEEKVKEFDGILMKKEEEIKKRYSSAYKRREDEYNVAIREYERACVEVDTKKLKKLSNAFINFCDYKDSAEYVKKCADKIEYHKNYYEKKYNEANKLMKEGQDISDMYSAIRIFEEISKYSDCETLIAELEEKIEKYNKGVEALRESKYIMARIDFQGIEDFLDTKKLIEQSREAEAVAKEKAKKEEDIIVKVVFLAICTIVVLVSMWSCVKM